MHVHSPFSSLQPGAFVFSELLNTASQVKAVSKHVKRSKPQACHAYLLEIGCNSWLGLCLCGCFFNTINQHWYGPKSPCTWYTSLGHWWTIPNTPRMLRWQWLLGLSAAQWPGETMTLCQKIVRTREPDIFIKYIYTHTHIYIYIQYTIYLSTFTYLRQSNFGGAEFPHNTIWFDQ